MRFFIKLFFLEFKRMTKLMPKLFLGALALCSVLIILAGVSQKLIYKTQPQERLTIMVYIPEDDKYINMMMGIVESIKSVKSFCTFEYTQTKEEIYTAVENTTAYGGIIFPKNFVQSIINGKNYSATIVIPRGTNTNSALFKELVEGGSGMLSAVQAGIYAFIDEYELEYKQYPTEELIDSVNMEYVNLVLPREKYFSPTEWSATSRLTPLEYYTAMGISLFLLFFGISCVKILHTEHKQVYDMGAVYGFNFVWEFIIKHILMLILFTIITGLILAGLFAAGLEPQLSVYIFMGIWLVSAIVTGIYTVIKDDVGAGLVLFAYTILSGVLSGCFLPVSFLPTGLNTVYRLMPTYYVAQCFSNIFYETEVNMLAYCIVTAVIYAVVVVCKCVKMLNKE